MQPNQLYLFKERRFLPIFIVQFCGCLNDSILKNALIILITYKLSISLGYSAQMLVISANTLFILPFVLFASLSGQIADRYERSHLVKIIKVCEVAIVALATYGFVNNNLVVLFFSILLMGTHSAFFGPIKYSVLPDHLKKEELLSANGLVEAGTFIAILIGTILGGFYNFSGNFIIVLLMIISFVGLFSSFFMPLSNNTNPDIKINLNLYEETKNILKYSYSKKQVYLAILGISWFWFIGAAILSQIPSLTKDILGADENVANLFIATFSIGVGFGSFVCSKILSNEITTKYLFISAIGLSLFGIDLFFASRISAVNYEPEQLKSIFVFLTKKHNWRIVIDLFCFSTIGGIHVVPLYAIMQYFASPAHRSRIIAANNLVNSLFMAGSTLILTALFHLNYSIPFVILLVSLFNMVVALYIYQLVPENKIIPFKLWVSLFRLFFDNMYKVEVRGMENFHKAGKRAVIIANHVSYIDPALLASYLPANLIFAIDATVSRKFIVKPFLKIVKALPIDTTNPMAIKSLINIVKKDRMIAIFPEGRITTTGSLMKVYEGPGMIADKADACILPIRIEGSQYTHFSKLKRKMKLKLCPKVIITILPPVRVAANLPENARDRRKHIGQELYDIMAGMMFESSDYKKTLFQSLIEASKTFEPSKTIMQDIDNNYITYRGLLLKSFTLANVIAKQTESKEYVGWMFPNMVGSVVAFYAILVCGRVPTMINFTSGPATILSGCKTAGIKIIYTSRKFVQKAELDEVINELELADIKILYLEDIRSQINLGFKIRGMFGAFFPKTYYEAISKKIKDTDPAVILFTSGTEGQPKAVVLSHRNIQANRFQIVAKVDFGPHDIAFNALPMFHSFGLMATILMSVSGIRTYFYPTPIHYRIIPEIIYYIGATIMFGTDTFLNHYAKYAHPYDFYSMRYVFAGAEKLKKTTRQFWLDKYGVRIFEGYGVTEASPVIAANTPMHDRPGSVGRLMSGIEHHIEPVEGISNGGQLYIKGPNLMLGYIHSETPSIIQNVSDKKLGAGWYDTGDIVSIDDEGYMTILGRAKRFAKIAGEMISLQVIEDIAYNLDPDHSSATVTVIDEKKGERVLLFTTSGSMDKEKLAKAIVDNGLSELHIPQIVKIKELPLLATGKANYLKLKEIADKET